MKQVISKSGALKAFYYLMAIDGDVTAELEKFDEIGNEFMKDGFVQVRQSIIDECQAQIDSAVIDDELYDIIQEGLDRALNETVDRLEDGVAPRLLVWDMLSIAYTDNDYAEPEKRLIAHVARVMEIEKDVLMEMEHLMRTAEAVVSELDTLNNSNRPYSEIRPVVDEIEKRKQTIAKSAEELIADDYVLDKPDRASKATDQSILSDAGRRITETLNPVADQMGEFAKKTFSDAKDIVDKIPDTSELTAGAGKLFSKMRGMIGKPEGFKLPPDFTLISKEESLDVGIPGTAWVFNKIGEYMASTVYSVKISPKEAMDFDNPDALVESIHRQMNDGSGLIEVKNGKTKRGGKYIYSVIKSASSMDFSQGNIYNLVLNVQVDNDVFYLQGYFRETGMTGMRESMVASAMMSDDSIKRDSNGMILGWSRDPYDENFNVGFLMNISEEERFDPQFPLHPLSELRAFKDYIIKNN